MPEWLGEALKAEVARWREDPVLTLLVLAIVPAIVEEFFFRGFLFGALNATTGPRNAILVTAGLFGLFHVFTSGILTIERFLPTALMGLALGWLRWRSASIFPGMILHALHNAVLLSLALFPNALGEELEKAQSVPWPWLLLGIGGAALGFGLIWIGKPRQPGP
jgi:ABC-2 type transport system permease protein/sodium transport system permease protein